MTAPVTGSIRGACVIDASTALKWVLDEAGSAEAAALLDGRQLLAPALLPVEAANALWSAARRGRLTGAEAADALDLLLRAPLDLVAEECLIPAALRLAQMLDHPVYDCVYLALAMQRGLPVVTADRRFVAAASRQPEAAALVRPLTAGPGSA